MTATRRARWGLNPEHTCQSSETHVAIYDRVNDTFGSYAAVSVAAVGARNMASKT